MHQVIRQYQECLRCLPRMQRLDGWRESTSWVEWPFAQLNRAVFRRYSFEWLLRIKKPIGLQPSKSAINDPQPSLFARPDANWCDHVLCGSLWPPNDCGVTFFCCRHFLSEVLADWPLRQLQSVETRTFEEMWRPRCGERVPHSATMCHTEVKFQDVPR